MNMRPPQVILGLHVFLHNLFSPFELCLTLRIWRCNNIMQEYCLNMKYLEVNFIPSYKLCIADARIAHSEFLGGPQHSPPGPSLAPPLLQVYTSKTPSSTTYYNLWNTSAIETEESNCL